VIKYICTCVYACGSRKYSQISIRSLRYLLVLLFMGSTLYVLLWYTLKSCNFTRVAFLRPAIWSVIFTSYLHCQSTHSYVSRTTVMRLYSYCNRRTRNLRMMTMMTVDLRASSMNGARGRWFTYVLSGCRRLVIMSLASSETLSNSGLWKSKFPAVTLHIVSASLSPMNGDRPDSLLQPHTSPPNYTAIAVRSVTVTLPHRYGNSHAM